MQKQNILFLVHVQEEFRRFFPDPLYPLRVRRSAMAKKYTQVISLVAEINSFDAIHELETVPFVKKRIFIGGGYNTECLEDWRAVLRACDLEFTEIPGLIY